MRFQIRLLYWILSGSSFAVRSKEDGSVESVSGSRNVQSQKLKSRKWGEESIPETENGID